MYPSVDYPPWHVDSPSRFACILPLCTTFVHAVPVIYGKSAMRRKHATTWAQKCLTHDNWAPSTIAWKSIERGLVQSLLLQAMPPSD